MNAVKEDVVAQALVACEGWGLAVDGEVEREGHRRCMSFYGSLCRFKQVPLRIIWNPSHSEKSSKCSKACARPQSVPMFWIMHSGCS